MKKLFLGTNPNSVTPLHSGFQGQNVANLGLRHPPPPLVHPYLVGHVSKNSVCLSRIIISSIDNFPLKLINLKYLLFKAKPKIYVRSYDIV